MSEDTLRRFMDRLSEDGSFLERVKNDPQGVWQEFELSPTEQVAISSGDEDALRRLAGTDVSAFALSTKTGFYCTAGCAWPTIGCTIYTWPGHKQGCGFDTDRGVCPEDPA